MVWAEWKDIEMAEYISRVNGLSQEDLSTAVKILYEHVEDSWANERPLPNKVELIKLAWSEFSIGLLEGKRLVGVMEETYKDDLREMGYK